MTEILQKLGFGRRIKSKLQIDNRDLLKRHTFNTKEQGSENERKSGEQWLYLYFNLFKESEQIGAKNFKIRSIYGTTLNISRSETWSNYSASIVNSACPINSPLVAAPADEPQFVIRTA